MNCAICGSPMKGFLAKRFPAFGLDRVEYVRCDHCGFVASKTHAEMSPESWEKLNHDAHSLYQGTGSSPYDDPLWIPRLEKQALMISDAQQLGLVKKTGRLLDYACGDGKLSDITHEQHGLALLKYERFMNRQAGYLKDADLTPGGFDFVITTSVFEHLSHREYFDAIAGLVSPDGVLAIHTLVCEAVPADAMWFYMNPVHCAFHTNRSMELLLQQWGYTCSIYNLEAKLWFCFKSEPQAISAIIQSANLRKQGPAYVFKEGFVDYWKGSPMQRTFGEAEKATQRLNPQIGRAYAGEAL